MRRRRALRRVAAPDRPDVSESRDSRRLECVRKAALLVRVSSEDQAKNSKGSIEFQRSQQNQVHRFGGNPQAVPVYDALGQSTRQGVSRPDIEHLREAIRRGDVRCLILGWTSRLGRTLQGPVEDLLKDLKGARGAIISQGRYFDLTDYEDAHRVRYQILDAQLQNEQRAFECSVSRYTQAAKLELALPLPTGLVWASPTDQRFERAMDRAGLADQLTSTALQEHRTRVQSLDGARYVFPDPRDDCWKAVQFIGHALIRGGSVASALEAVRDASGTDYPRPGYLPSVRSSLYGRGSVRWTPVRGRPDGRDEQAVVRVRNHFSSPALYGVYSFMAPSLDGKGELLSVQGDVWEEAAFPGLFDRADEEIIRRAIADPARRFRRKAPRSGPRTHIVRRLTCAHPLPNGSICGLSLSPFIGTDHSSHHYVSTACQQRGHAGCFPAGIDSAIRAALQEHFTAEVVERNLRVELSEKGRLATEATDLGRAMQALQAQVDYAKISAANAHAAGDVVEEEDWLRHNRRLLGELRAAAQRHEQVKFQMERNETLSASERRRIIDLANDFPRLLGAALSCDNLAQQLTAPLVETVRVRRLAMGVYWLEVVFPGGATARRLHYGVLPATTEAVRALAFARLEPFLSVEARALPEGDRAAMDQARRVASEWNALAVRRIGGRPMRAWDPERVLAAAYAFNEGRDLAPGGGESVTLDEVAARHGFDSAAVLAEALRGHLGSPAGIENGNVQWVLRGRLAMGPSHPTRSQRTPSTPPPRDATLVHLGAACAERGLDPRLVLTRARELKSTVTGRYPHEQVERAALEGVEATGHGSWLTFAEAAEQLMGVARATLEYRAYSGRLGRHRVFWVDEALMLALRSPTVEEVLAEQGRSHIRGQCHRLGDVVSRLGGPGMGPISEPMVVSWVKRGVLDGFSAAEAGPFAPVRRWVIVPPEVWDARDPAVVRAWLPKRRRG